MPKETVCKMNECLCCGSKKMFSREAVMSLFLSEYVFKRKPWVLEFVECEDCGSRFFSHRYSDSEGAALYSNYRGEQYFKARHSAEPWYSQAVNNGIGSDPEEVKIRKEMLTDHIAASGFPEKAKNKKAKMLDYGGDRGQFIPDIPNTEKYCFEISDAEPDPEVVKFSSFSQFSNMKFDIIFCCEVLEHLSDPMADIEKIGSLLEKNSQAYFEVPYEIYSVPKNMGTLWYGRYLKLVSKSRTLTIGIDFLSTLCRVKMGFVPFFGFVKQHEHINFYTKKGLEKFVERNGFKVNRIEIVTRRSPSGVSRTLSCLAEKM